MMGRVLVDLLQRESMDGKQRKRIYHKGEKKKRKKKKKKKGCKGRGDDKLLYYYYFYFTGRSTAAEGLSWF